MNKIIKLTESDLVRLIKRVINEQQEGNPITFSRVVEIDNKDKNTLHNNLIQSLTLVFNSLKDIKQLDDKDTGLIILKPKMKFDIKGQFLTGYSGFLSYTLKIQIKDNKFKIDISDLFYEGNPQYPTTNLGPITDREKFGEKGQMIQQKNKVWEELKTTIPVRMESLMDVIVEKVKGMKLDDFQP